MEVRYGFEQLKNEPGTVALGFFDGVHRGHAEVIREAAKHAAALGIRTVAATFTRHPSEFLGGEKTLLLTPNPLKERIFASLGVDCVVYIDFPAVREMAPAEFVETVLIKGLGARFVACGYNYRFGAEASAGPEDLERLCAAHGAGMKAMPQVCAGGAPVSSTRIRELVRRGDMPAAAELLGRPYALLAKVVHGRQLGRKLGFPTINQPTDPGLCLPRFGVYATSVALHGKILPAVTNIGVRPTVGGGDAVAESYIPGFSGDLYGEELRLDFLRFIRPEIKFDNLEELKAQMAADEKAAIGA